MANLTPRWTDLGRCSQQLSARPQLSYVNELYHLYAVWSIIFELVNSVACVVEQPM